MPVFDLTEFFKLSSALNYNLSAASLNRYNVLMYILAGRRLDADDQKDREQKGVLMEASVAFLVIFLSFLNDREFYIKGISAKGIEPG
jgi:hypothetical protein